MVLSFLILMPLVGALVIAFARGLSNDAVKKFTLCLTLV